MSESDFTAQLKMLSGMPAAEFVLHREPMLLLDRLVDVGPEYAICEWQVCDKIRFFVAGLGVPAYIGIEYMAQCVAVHAGARARVQGLAPPLGFLLGTRHYKAAVKYFETRVIYSTKCTELIRDDQGMGSFECRITQNDNVIAEGRLAVLEKKAGKRLDE